MKTTFKLWLAGGLTALALASGCSSNSNDNAGVTPGPAAAATVPDSAGTSVAGFLAFLLALSPNDETSEPLLIKDGFAVPADESNAVQTLT